MRKQADIKVIMHLPKTVEGREALAKAVAEVHADFVIRRIKKLRCPTSQKLKLLDAIIRQARQDAVAEKIHTKERKHVGTHETGGRNTARGSALL